MTKNPFEEVGPAENEKTPSDERVLSTSEEKKPLLEYIENIIRSGEEWLRELYEKRKTLESTPGHATEALENLQGEIEGLETEIAELKEHVVAASTEDEVITITKEK